MKITIVSVMMMITITTPRGVTIGWGLLIDAIGERAPIWLGLSWNRFTIFFAAAACAYLATLALARRLDEPQAASMEELLAVEGMDRAAALSLKENL